MQEDKVKMVEIKIYLDLKITKMHSKIVAGFYSSHLLVFVRLAKLYRCRVFSSIENRPLSSKNFVICVYHRLDNISVHAPWTLIGRYTKIVMMYVSFGKAKLKKICPEIVFPTVPKLSLFGGVKSPPIRLAVNVNVSYNKKKIQKYPQNIAADFTK